MVQMWYKTLCTFFILGRVSILPVKLLEVLRLSVHPFYDLVTSRTHEGNAFRMLNVLDENTRECLNITVERKITRHQVIEKLADLFITRGIPDHIRSDNGPEFTAKAVRRWLGRLGLTTLFIEPAAPVTSCC